MSDDDPRSVVPGPTLVQLDDVARARRITQSDAPTLVPCPWCDSIGMTTGEKAAEWHAAYPELSQEPTP